MNNFAKHEIFEIEVLEKLKSAKVIDSLVFGGGTMLRLCHEMKRYSADLDFWRLKETSEDDLLKRFRSVLQQDYQVTDAEIKRFTILLEIRCGRNPRLLKIEIRKEMHDWDFEEKIAFSKFSTRQVLLKAHTLAQTMINKTDALLDRAEIRDAHDMEFLLRQGTALPQVSQNQTAELIRRVDRFKDRDFKVTLGSVLEADERAYYNQNGFRLLRQRLLENQTSR